MTGSRRFRGIVPLIALVGLALLTGAQSSQASQVFVTPTGSTTGGGPVSARATFTESAGSLSITITNLQANPTDVAQLISDLFFTVGSLTPNAAGTLITATVPLINIAANGTVTNAAATTTNWNYTATSTVGHLDDLAGPASGPANLIIGPAGAGGVYTAANGSIAGNGPHNPFINQTATFVISDPLITANTVVTAATFSFGTTPGINVVGVPAVPEPSTIVSACMGVFGGIGVWVRNKRKKLQS
jgi:hypothetical protein